ncbi:MAG: cupredoxin domain-containing protein [Chloroflexi bacterium]|nr:cupredoxin domain-containing protein [Chloroflexota bacterium]
MRVWLPVIVLGILVVGTVAYIVGARAGAVPLAAQPGTPLGEYISGIKRTPGTWKDPSINVGANEANLGTPDVTIDVDVMRPVFVPSQIKVKQGQVVKLRLHGKDNGLADTPEIQQSVGLKEFSGHGFQILGPYDVWITGIRKGDTKEITFKADVAGEFPFECVVFCSTAHYAMQGKLIVEPQ